MDKIQSAKNITLIFISLAFLLFLQNVFFTEARNIVKYNEKSDFSAYYQAYRNVQLGKSVYFQPNIEENNKYYPGMDSGRKYIYSPFLGQTLSLLMPQNYKSGRLSWLMIETVASILLAFLIFRIISNLKNKSAIHASIATLIVFSSSSPLIRDMHYGQVTIILTVLMLASIFLLTQGHAFIASILISIALLIKPFALIIIIACAIRQKWKPIFLTCITTTLIVLILATLFGLEDWRTYTSIYTSRPLLDRGDSFMALLEQPNYSQSSLIHLFSNNTGTSITQKTSMLISLIAFSMTCFLIILKVGIKRLFALEFWHLLNCGIMAILIVSPISWNHYYVMLMPLFSVFIYNASTKKLKKTYLYGTICSFVLIMMPDFLVNTSITNHGALVAFKFTKLYGLYILVALYFNSIRNEDEAYSLQNLQVDGIPTKKAVYHK